MYRYIDARGMQKRLAFDNDLADAIRSGEVKPGTMLGEGETGAWVPASRHPAYQRLAKSVGVSAKPAASGNAWRRRALIALPVLALVALGYTQVRARQQRAQLTRAYQEALVGVQAGHMPPAELLTAEPPEDERLEIMWIDLRAGADVIAAADSAMARYGVTSFDPPAAWLTPEYLRNARMHGDVGRHWSRYMAFHNGFVARMPQMTRDAMHRYAQLADPSRYRASILALDVDEKMQERMRPWHVRGTIAGAADELHKALVRADGRTTIARSGGLEVSDPSIIYMVNAQLARLKDNVAALPVFEQPLRPDQLAVLDAPPATVRSSATDDSFDRDARTVAEMREETRRGLEAAERVRERARSSDFNRRRTSP